MSESPINRSVLLIGLAALVGLAGCSAWSTYPPVEHTAKLTSPASAPIPRLMAMAIVHVNREYGGGAGAFAFNLPEGVPAPVYEQVKQRLGGAGHPLTDPAELAYHVTQVRSRGTEAEVDVIYPRADGLHQLATVHFNYSVLNDHQVDSVKLWRVRAEAPAPGYITTTPTETAAATGPDE